MTKEELERQKWNDIFLEDCAVYDKKIAEEYTTLEEQIAKLKEENKELKEVHESDKRSLRLIAEKIAELEKENAELNKKLSKAEEEYDKMFWNKNEIISKATEIIEGLMRFCRCFAQQHTEDYRYKEAEQFLKECE